MMMSYPEISMLKFLLSHSIPASITGVPGRMPLFSIRISSQWSVVNPSESRRRMSRPEASRRYELMVPSLPSEQAHSPASSWSSVQ